MDALDRITDAVEAGAGRLPPVEDTLRVGLGVVILLAGAHKLVAPGDWGRYLAPVFAERWPVPVDATMVAFGLSELPFGAALVVDRYAALSAAVVAVSTLGVLVDWRSSRSRPGAAPTSSCGTWRCSSSPSA